MPFVNHIADDQVAYSNTPFANGELRYEEVEPGLWLIITNIEFKVNVHTKAIYDTEPADYFFLIFTIYQNDITPRLDMKINNVAISSNSWALYRPGIQVDGFHNSGTKGLIFNFVFNKVWLENNLLGEESPHENLIQGIISSDLGHLEWPEVLPEGEMLGKNIWNHLSKKKDKYLSKLQLKIHVLEILNIFFVKINQKNKVETEGLQTFGSRTSSDMVALKKVEVHLIQNLQSAFPGIAFLSDLANMSPSKLKSDFKMVYGKTIFQYFKEKQMELAFQMLKNTNTQIKNIATNLGYDSPGKFAKAFKKHHNILPSQLKDIHSS